MLIHYLIMTSYCCQRYAECLVTTLCSSRTVHRTLRRTRATVELLRQETPNFLAPNLWPSNSPDLSLWTTRSGLSCSIVSTTDKSIVWMNWNGGSSVYGACSFEQSIFDETNDQWRGRHRVLKEDILSTACELTMLILCICVAFNVTYLTVTSLITKLCQQRWLIHSCSFYKVVH